MRAVLAWAGGNRVTLQVAEGNTAAVALYRRLGFTGAGRLEYQTRCTSALQRRASLLTPSRSR